VVMRMGAHTPMKAESVCLFACLPACLSCSPTWTDRMNLNDVAETFRSSATISTTSVVHKHLPPPGAPIVVALISSNGTWSTFPTSFSSLYLRRVLAWAVLSLPGADAAGFTRAQCSQFILRPAEHRRGPRPERTGHWEQRGTMQYPEMGRWELGGTGLLWPGQRRSCRLGCSTDAARSTCAGLPSSGGTGESSHGRNGSTRSETPDPAPPRRAWT
jgi:hypothetical protein